MNENTLPTDPISIARQAISEKRQGSSEDWRLITEAALDASAAREAALRDALEAAYIAMEASATVHQSGELFRDAEKAKKVLDSTAESANAYTASVREKAYLAGFMASGEGWNGEYGFSGRDPQLDEYWIENREANLKGSNVNA